MFQKESRGYESGSCPVGKVPRTLAEQFPVLKAFSLEGAAPGSPFAPYLLMGLPSDQLPAAAPGFGDGAFQPGSGSAIGLA